MARLGGLAHLGEMIFIPRSYGIFYLTSIKKFLLSLEKIVLITFLSIFYNNDVKPWETNYGKKFINAGQMFLYYLINIWKEKKTD